MQRNLKSIFICCLVIVFGQVGSILAAETIFDHVDYITNTLITNFSALRLCDSMQIIKTNIDVGDCRLYCEVEGNGVPLVLINGGPGGTHHCFHPYFSQATNFAKIIYYDQRGCGLSESYQGFGYTMDQAVDDLDNIRKALNLENWVVVGWSYGGSLAQNYLLKYPQHTAGAVLIGSALCMHNSNLLPSRQTNYISTLEQDRITAVYAEVNTMYTNGTISWDRYNELDVYNLQINGDWKRQYYYKPTSERMAQDALYEWEQAFPEFRIQAGLSELLIDLTGKFQDCTVPTIICEGTWDLTWNTDKPGVLHTNHPGSELVMFPASAHGPFIDEPDYFFNTISNFVGGLPPIITVSPAPQTVNAGQPAAFSVTAAATTPLWYQWQKDAANIGGATNVSYTLPTTVTDDNGVGFRVVVTNLAGAVTSAVATLTVAGLNVPPAITTQPSNQTVTVGATATFSVTATGTAPLFYQWESNAVNIGGATNGSYTTAATVTNDNGVAFRVVVSNAFGNVTSSEATLTVTSGLIAWWKFDEGTGTNVLDSSGNNQTGTLCAVAWVSGIAGQALSFTGATSRATFAGGVSVPPTHTFAAWIYPVPPSDTYGALFAENNNRGLWYEGTSHKLNFWTYESHKSNTAMTENQWHHIAVVEVNSGSMTFYLDGQADGTVSGGGGYIGYFMGCDNSSENFKGWMDEVRVYNRALSADEVAALAGNAAITTQPVSLTNNPGSSASFTVVALGTPPLYYRWQTNTVNIGLATNATYTIDSVAAGDAGSYRCIVSNMVNAVTSTEASLTVNIKPALGAASVSNVMAHTAYLGGNVTATNGYPVNEQGIYWGTNSETVLAVGTKYSTNGTFGVGVFSFFVTNLPSGRTNYFLAYAMNSQGTNFTGESLFLTRPDAPVMLAATNGTINAFWANWQTTESATNYWLDVAPTNDFASYLAGYSNQMVGAALTYSVTGLQARTEYYYRVRAENGTGIGVDSGTQTVSAAAIGLLPESLTYTGTYGGANPAAQTVVVTNLGNRGFDFTNTTTYSAGAPGWWTATPATGRVDGLMAMAITGSVSLTGINAGTYYATNAVVSADATNSPQYLVATLTVNKAAQAITNFTPVNGSAFATTSAVVLAAQASSGLPVTFEVVSGPGQLAGASLTFTNAGQVSVKALQAGDTNYLAAPSLTNTYNKVAATVTLGNLTQVYDGTPKTVTSTTVPAGLTVDATYDGHVWAPSNVGSYAVAATINDATYQGSANGTLFITKATATVTLNNLNQTYDGTARSVTATTVPAGLSAVVMYDGSATAPVNAGSFDVIGTISDVNYQVAANGTLVVAKANQTITFQTIPDQVVTSQVTLSATAVSGLPVTFAAGSGPAVISGGTRLSFAGVGTVSIVASQAGNANWNAAVQVVRSFLVQPAVSLINGILDADFDGDRLADPSIYDESTGTWTIKMSGSGYMTMTLADMLGGPGYAVAVSDYDGDGLSDPAVYQESTGNWKVMQSGSGYAMLERNAFLGGTRWVPASAYYEGDHNADYAVYQETTGNWKVKLASAAYAEIDLPGFLGSPGNSAIPADYDGDGLADPAVYNRTDGTWKVLLSSAGYAPVTLPQFLGGTGWNAVPGDYDGDGLADPAVRKTDGSVWRIMLSGSGYVSIDLPLGL